MCNVHPTHLNGLIIVYEARLKYFRKLLCYPYFMVIGQQKCGSTSLFHQLIKNSQIIQPKLKEPHFFTKKSFHLLQPFDLKSYSSIFQNLAKKLTNNGHDTSKDSFVTGDFSNSYMWYNGPLESKLRHFINGYKNYSYTLPQLIKDTLPSVKVIAIVRNPTDR